MTKVVDTSDEWITSRTGISRRHIAINETCTSLATVSAFDALGRPFNESELVAKAPYLFESDCKRRYWNKDIVDPGSIDLIILTSVSPDSIVPNNASLVKRLLGCDNAIAFDLNAACSGFVYALDVARSMMTASNTTDAGTCNPIKRALVISSERLTRITDWSDRNTCVLFGDGAGSAVLEWKADQEGVLSTYLENTDDNDNSLICKNVFDSDLPFDSDGVIYNEEKLESFRSEELDPRIADHSYINSLNLSADPATGNIDELLEIALTDKYAPYQVIHMEGQRVFKFAAKAMERAVRNAAKRAKIEVAEIDRIVPHQANLRIIEFAAKRLGLPLDRFQISIQETGNTSSSCMPMSLADALCDGSIKEGDTIALVAFGGGLTSGAAIIRI